MNVRVLYYTAHDGKNYQVDYYIWNIYKKLLFVLEHFYIFEFEEY